MSSDLEPWELPHMKNQPNDAAFWPACGGTIDFMVDELSKHARDLFVALNGHEPETPPIFDDVIAEAVFELRKARAITRESGNEPAPEASAITSESVATGTESRVCADIAARQALGRAKYGTTVEENPLPLAGWLRHAYEEALDLAIYLKRAGEDAAVDDAERAALAATPAPAEPVAANPYAHSKNHASVWQAGYDAGRRSMAATPAPAEPAAWMIGDKDERAAFDAWAEGFGLPPTSLNTVEPWAAWKARAALASTPAPSPKGWKLVPVEPTPEMLWALFGSFVGQLTAGERKRYAAMLAAAPEAATPAPARCANGPMGCDYPRCDCNGASTKESKA